MKLLALFCLVALAAFIDLVSSKDYVRGCYYTNWSQHRKGVYKFMPENIEADLCSHIFFAFASMNEKFEVVSIEKNDQDINGVPGLYNRVNSLKTKQADLKTLLSFGGFLFQQQNGPLMRKMLAEHRNRRIFVDSAITLMVLYKFDGFDMNWYPDAETKNDYVLLIQEFRTALDDLTTATHKPKLLLTAAVPPFVDLIKAGYDSKNLTEYLDWMNVNAFDYHGGWEKQIGFNSPMVDRNHDGLSINSTFSYLIEREEIPRNKLVMGYATYGRGWTLPSKTLPNSIPSPAKGPSPRQMVTLADGFAAYFEICQLIEKDRYQEGFDKIQEVPWIFKDGVWISYDDTKSFGIGLDWLIQNDLRGAFAWSFDLDDFVGSCKSSKGKYPLMREIRSKLANKQ